MDGFRWTPYLMAAALVAIVLMFAGCAGGAGGPSFTLFANQSKTEADIGSIALAEIVRHCIKNGCGRDAQKERPIKVFITNKIPKQGS